MSAWVFLLLGGMDSIVFGPIRWCVWSFRPSSPLRLPHLKFLFVFVCFCDGSCIDQVEVVVLPLCHCNLIVQFKENAREDYECLNLIVTNARSEVTQWVIGSA